MQKALLADLRKRLASCGHLILCVSKHRRRYRCDFIAVPKDNPTQFLIAHPTCEGRVRVRPYGCDTLYVTAKRVVDDLRKAHGKKIGWYNQIPISRLKLGLQHYVTPAGKEELEKLIGLYL